MKQEFEKYLAEMKLSSFMVDNLNEKYKLICAACGVDEFDEIFVSEGVSNAGIREYFMLWGFTEQLMCRISINKSDITIYRYKNYIRLVMVNEVNFDLKSPNEESRLQYAVRRTDSEKSITYSASGMNCKHLLKIAYDYFLPNVKD